MTLGARHLPLFVLLVLGPLACASAGCSRSGTLSSFEGTITMQTTRGGQTHEMVVQTKADKLRFDIMGPTGPTHAVYDPATSKVVFFIDGEKKYMDMDFFVPSVSKAPHTDPDTSTITRSGSHKKVAGYDCEEVSVTDAMDKRSDVCIAQGIAYFDVNGLRPGLQRGESAMAREYRTHKSFPLESIETGPDGKEVSRMEVTKIEKKSLADSVFAIPPDYTKVELPNPNRTTPTPAP